MVRPVKKGDHQNGRVRLDVTVDPDNRKWLEDQVITKVFKDLSHGIDSVILTIRSGLDIQLDPECLEFLDQQTGKKVFADNSHGVNYCVDIIRRVFEGRQKQIEQLARSAAVQDSLESIDEAIILGTSATGPGDTGEEPES
ncbi:hypothetical protein ES703_28290 [subsurface metagenome]